MGNNNAADVDFRWQDDGTARVRKFICVCGNNLVDCDDYSVSDGDKEWCPKCHRTYRYQWIGMIIVERKRVSDKVLA